MIPPPIVVGIILGLVVEAVLIAYFDHRALQREERWWAELRADALDGYLAVFDWAEEPDL